MNRYKIILPGDKGLNGTIEQFTLGYVFSTINLQKYIGKNMEILKIEYALPLIGTIDQLVATNIFEKTVNTKEFFTRTFGIELASCEKEEVKLNVGFTEDKKIATIQLDDPGILIARIKEQTPLLERLAELLKQGSAIAAYDKTKTSEKYIFIDKREIFNAFDDELLRKILKLFSQFEQEKTIGK